MGSRCHATVELMEFVPVVIVASVINCLEGDDGADDNEEGFPTW